MGVFTSKGTIQKEFCGHSEAKWILKEHNTQQPLRVYPTFKACIEDVYPLVIECSRPPTVGEIRFGHGATHYADFSPMEMVKDDGSLKQWFKHGGLRWHRT